MSYHKKIYTEFKKNGIEVVKIEGEPGKLKVYVKTDFGGKDTGLLMTEFGIYQISKIKE